jgi:radical SAM superfamily enzyme YgiQ (UPF0313 family)
MKKNILMVYPEIPPTYWGFKHALPFIKKRATVIPLGLVTVAALLPGDYDVHLVDMNIEPLTPDQITTADLVFISAMIIQKRSFDNVVALCNNLGTPVVAGGPYPTSSHEKITGVDYFVLDEAEMTLSPFIRDYEAGHPQHIYRSSEKPDVRHTPVPRFELLDMSAYNNLAIQASRGCPFNCEFCDIIQLFGRVPRYKTPEQFTREMDRVYELGFRGSLFIVDDNFIGNRARVKELVRGVIVWQQEHNYPFSLFTEASIDLSADDELMELMADAGFNMVFVGIETPDTASLASCGKHQNLKEDILGSVEKIQRYGIEVTGGFIVGFDTDTSDIFQRQIDFIRQAGIPMAMVGLLSAIPHTRLYRRLSAEGRLKADREWTGNNTHDLSMNFMPVIPEDELVAGYRMIIKTLYAPRDYFSRCRSFLMKMPSRSIRHSRKLKENDIRALLMSLTIQSLSRYGFWYLKFLLTILIRRPSLFPLAMEFAIKGHHLITMTREILKADDFSRQFAEAAAVIREKCARLAENQNAAGADDPGTIGTLIAVYRKKLNRRYRRLNRNVRQYLDAQQHDLECFFDERSEALRGATCGCHGDPPEA